MVREYPETSGEKFHLWFVCCVPPLIGPKRVVKSGGPARSKRVRRFGKSDQWVRRGLPRSSPTTPSATLKVRRPQFAAAGREAAPRIHYATHSAAWHTHAWGVIGGTGCDWGWVDCMRGCRATSLFRSVGKGGEGRREEERGRGGGRGRGRGRGRGEGPGWRGRHSSHIYVDVIVVLCMASKVKFPARSAGAP